MRQRNGLPSASLIVPGRATVVIFAGGAGDQGCRLLAGQRRDAEAIKRDQAGEESIEPSTLLFRERCGVRHQ